MKMKTECLPCMINQVLKVTEMTGTQDRETLLRQIFAYLSTVDYNKTTPEMIGTAFRKLKAHTGNPDPYYKLRNYYNQLFLGQLDELEQQILKNAEPFHQAVKMAILGNIIDFNPIHGTTETQIRDWFAKADTLELEIDHSNSLAADLKQAKTLLYLGDNCGEICLDKLLIRQIRKLNPQLKIWFGVRGAPVVNDSIEEDAYLVGMQEEAMILSNGDDSLGTVLERTSEEFQSVFQAADMILAKGQANYECLNETAGKNCYFLMMTKCAVIATDAKAPLKSLVCLNHPA